jgi:hypothetical protein
MPRPVHLPHLGRAVPELGRPGDHRHRLHLPLEPADGADHLEGEVRHPVAELRQRQPLEDDVCRVPIGRGLAIALLGLDQAVGLLPRRAAVEAVTGVTEVERLAIGPDPVDAGDRPLAQPDREIGEVAVLLERRLARPALAAASLRLFLAHLLLEACRPDHLASDPHPPIDPRDRRSLARGLDVEVGEAPALDRPFGREQRLVERIAGNRADSPADHHPDRAKDRADRGAGGGEKKRGHGRTPRGMR